MSDIRKFGPIEVDMDAVRDSAAVWQADFARTIASAQRRDQVLRGLQCPCCGKPIKTDERIHLCLPLPKKEAPHG